MGRKKSNLDLRILKEADRLFYFQGYNNTGINQIVKEAGTNKPGLYTYFEGKEDLARRYLQARNQLVIDRIINRAGEAQDIFEFFRLWMQELKEFAVGKDYYGCPIVNFAAQTDSKDTEMLDFVMNIGRKWHSHLVAYIRKEKREGRFKGTMSAGAVARRMLVANEGAINMWKVTGEMKYIDEGTRMFEDSIH